MDYNHDNDLKMIGRELSIGGEIMGDDRQDVDLLDVLRQRAKSGEPLYVMGTDAGANALAEKVAAEVTAGTGRPVRIIQVVDLEQVPRS